MRKELPQTYIYNQDHSVVVRARSQQGEMTERKIGAEDLILDLNYTDQQGTPKKGRVVLKPVAAQVSGLDLPSEEDLRILYMAAANCYSGVSDEELLGKAASVPEEEAESFLRRNIIATGHYSVLEHAKATFLVSGVSRACTHQLVRHRLASFSQQSQRYVSPNLSEEEEVAFPFIIPPEFRVDERFLSQYLSGIGRAVSGYYSLKEGGAFPEDARMLLPNAAASRIAISGNLRVWMELIPKRTCARAQWEVDMMATEIARQLWQAIPVVFEKIGPPCSRSGCDQGKRSCGVALKQPLSAFFDQEKYPHDRLIFGMR
ncbi:MAG: FAD-dependent thymidylate synthase [Patescibacteria group bacterium]|nr:FAD-dependent thymidylate synthase [Patescibacteria group bacterium]